MSKSRRSTGTLVAVVAALALLSGCAGQRTPGGYGDSVEKNFTKGCVATSEKDNVDEAAFGGSVKKFCQCAYNKLSGDGGVSFNEFKKVVDDQTDNPGTLPTSFTKVYADCNGESSDSSTTTAGG